MSNEYFQPGSVPATNSPGSSATIRNEFANIATAFDKLPTLAENAGFLISVDPTGTRLISAEFNSNDIATLDGTQTLTNKTITWDDNTFPGFGTAATKNASTVPGTGEVPVMVGPNLFGAIDGSNLINLNTDNFGDVVPVSKGGTGASDLSGAQVNLGIDLKADSFNAVFTGAPVAPTPSIGDNSVRIATTQFVQESVVATGSFAPSNAIPLMDGVASSGTGTLGSREDHKHPSDTTRAPSSAATAIGTSFSPTGGVSATTVQAAIAELDSEKVSIGSITAVGTSFTPAGTISATNVQAAIAELDNETQTALSGKAPLASPVFTGDPRAPTPASSDNDTSIATTAYVKTLLAQQPSGMQPSNATPLINGVATSGVGVEGSRYDHVHPVDTSRAPASAETAVGTTFTPAAGIAATNVQAAIEEVVADVTAPKSGDILQIVTHFDAGTEASASTWTNLTTVAAIITPKSTNSTLIVEAFATVSVPNIAGVNAQAVFQIYSGTFPAGNIGIYINPWAPSAAGGVGVTCGAALMAVVSNTSLTSKAYGLAGAPTTGIPNLIGAVQQAWKITEVQN
jgi:hypothetical protein